MIVFVAFSLLHVAFLLWVLVHWNRVPMATRQENGHVKLTVLVPVRNESGNIRHLLQDLERQEYPRDCFEVIVLDDQSEDGTADLVREFQQQTSMSLRLQAVHMRGAKGKKAALTLGVEQARHPYIVTTDGDCRLPATWLTAYADCYTTFHPKMITGPVRMQGEGIFGTIQSYEFAGLIGVGAASLASGHPGMCNGANLSYERAAFLEAEGYRGNRDIPSGDDEFLLQKLFKLYPDKVRFLKDQRAIVTTPAKGTLPTLINQRIRWSSKWRFHRSVFIRLMAIMVYLNYLSVLFALGICVLTGQLGWLLGVVAIRWFFTWFFVQKVGQFLHLGRMMGVSLLAEIIYPFFVSFLGLASIFGKYSWKGRHYT